jgi:hypothetical protein
LQAARHRNEVQQPPVQEAAPESVPESVPEVSEAPGGLAGAIARARSVTQEPLTPTGRTTGFKKI